MSKGVLVIGGMEAGIQAALDLADIGAEVHIVESTPFFGKNSHSKIPAHLFKTQVMEAAKHPRIKIWTNTCIDEVKKEAGKFSVELRQYPRFVDLSKCTACGDCVDVCPVTVPGKEHKAVYLSDIGQPGCAAIEKSGQAPCSSSCPGGIHVQGYVALTAQGRFKEAIELIREAIPFPGICGRICTHPCEVNCRRGDVDTSVSIRLLKRFLADWELKENKNNPSNDLAIPEYQDNACKVAIIGAGPAGMTAAEYLAKAGHRVTVFEKLPVVGGMLAVGIPAYRLPREVIASEYKNIMDLGVDVQLNTAIGPDGDYSFDDLLNDGYGAVCLTVGAHSSFSLGIPGEDLKNVVQGIELLKVISLSQQTKGPVWKKKLKALMPSKKNAKAVVLGGGNTAMDVSRALKRLGITNVSILYRRTRNEMPALIEEIEDAEHEGVKIEFLTAPKRIAGNKKNMVTGIECIRMELGKPDESGRRRPVPVHGSEFLLDIDMVVLAIGQAPDFDFLERNDDIAIGNDRRICIGSGSFMTDQKGIFAAGDAVTRDKMMAIEAIGMSKKMAREVDLYLRGEKITEIASKIPVSFREMTAEELTPKEKVSGPVLPAAKRIKNFDEVELGYSRDQAVKEAQRCLICGPCSECMACVKACKPEALIHNQNEILEKMNFDTVIYADNPVATDSMRLVKDYLESGEFYQVPFDNPIMGSAAACRVRSNITDIKSSASSAGIAPDYNEHARTGIFICKCGEEISGIINVDILREHALALTDVKHVGILPFSCRIEGAEKINEMISAHRLNRVVLAACSCCSFDQVCYSCTYQRMRCKSNLGVFNIDAARKSIIKNNGLNSADFEFVNIREQCAWVHADDPAAATVKAGKLIAAAVVKIREMSKRTIEPVVIDRSVIILGNSPASLGCMNGYEKQDVKSYHIKMPIRGMEHVEGCYVIKTDDGIVKAAAIMIAPGDAAEAGQLLKVFSDNGLNVKHTGNIIEMSRQGVFFCDPEFDTQAAADAVVARTCAWLCRVQSNIKPITGKVDPDKCRMCYTCIDVCEAGAPRQTGEGIDRNVWIDPALCYGCGTCAAKCPSNAICAGYSTDIQLEAMINELIVR